MNALKPDIKAAWAVASQRVDWDGLSHLGNKPMLNLPSKIFVISHKEHLGLRYMVSSIQRPLPEGFISKVYLSKSRNSTHDRGSTHDDVVRHHGLRYCSVTAAILITLRHRHVTFISESFT